MWAKISTSATAIACAACLATAATLPWAGEAAERIANENVRLAVDFSALDGFSAIPLYFDILFGNATERAEAIAGLDLINGIPPLLEFLTTGDVNALADYDALSAIPVFAAVANAATPQEAIDALADYDVVSAIPVFVGTDGVLTGGGVNALGGYDALSAVDTFFGDNNGDGGVFTGGGIDALAPDADGNGGYAALSAVPVFIGTDGVFTGGGVDALAGYDALSAKPVFAAVANAATPKEAIDALADYDALSAIPAYLTHPSAPEDLASESESTPLTTFKSAVTPPLPKFEGATAPVEVDNSGQSSQNIIRDSKKFTPESIGTSPILFGSTSGADNGIRGWGSALKKLGIGGGEESSSESSGGE